MRHGLRFIIGITAVLTVLFTDKSFSSARPFVKSRSLIIKEVVIIKNLPENISGLRVWLPYPVKDKWQEVMDFKLEGPFDYQILTDKEYGNKVIHLKAKQGYFTRGPLKISLSFKVARREYNLNNAQLEPGENLKRFLMPDMLVPINADLKKLAENITESKHNDLERVKAIYDYIIDQLNYAKDDPKVCGIGDSLLTLKHKKGICTDYHSLFISLVRSLGIPAKFEIGFRIPVDAEEGLLPGYHCWSKFYLKGKGWIAVDASEADKHPKMRDYYFGNIDENRLQLTSGRDIHLEYAKDIRNINFFVYPYAEINGEEFFGMETSVYYRQMKGGEVS